MNLFDFILIGIALVAVIIGLKKGFAKMITKALCVIVAFAGAFVATFVVIDLLKATTLFANLQGITTRWFSQPFMATQVTSQEQLAQLLASEEAGIFSSLGALSAQIFEGFQKAGVESLGGYFGSLLANIILGFGAWLVSYLVLKYVLLGLKKLICLLARVPVLKSIDKIFGAVVSVVVWYAIAICVTYTAFVVVCAMFFPEFAQQISLLVNDSMLFSYVHHTNFVGKMVCDMFQIDYTTLSAVAQF